MAALAGLLLLAAGCGDDGGGPDGGRIDGGSCSPETPLVEIPSRQEVRFEVSGTDAAYIATEGDYCLVMTLEDPGGAPVPLGSPSETVCVERPIAAPTVRLAIPASEMPVITWDGRALAGYTACTACDGGGVAPDQQHVLQPVGPGRYRARFVVLEAPLPFQCGLESDGNVHCTLPGGPMDPDSPTEICPGNRTVFADFDLPATGDVTVPLPIP